MLRTIIAFALVLLAVEINAQERQQDKSASQLLRSHHLADYDAELRLPNGRVDIDGMVKRLEELKITTYYWLVWHKATDWEDLKLFLPKASKAGVDVWVYLVPPTESPPRFGHQYSEPFRLDYTRWAVEIARLSVQYPNLTGWVIDDFYANHKFFTPTHIADLQAKSKAINPKLAFLPLMYYQEMRPEFIQDYRKVIDGVVVAYLQDRSQIERTWALLNDAALPPTSELGYPWHTPSRAGDFAEAGQSAKVSPANHYEVQFLEQDDFTGPTAGYHYKQFLVDGAVAWEEDVAGGTNTWKKVTVDITRYVKGMANVTLAFRLFDKKPVGNFGIRWRVRELQAKNLQLTADLSKPEKWRASHQGAFESGFGRPASIGQRRFHIPFISMTAADVGEFRLRHGDPATPERMADQLQISLQAWQEEKCDGVVTYCLDKRPNSQTFPPVQKLFQEFRGRGVKAEFGAEGLPVFDIKTKKAADQITVKIEKDAATFDISSPSGIGRGTISLTGDKWPTRVILRLHLRGLESLAVSSGKFKLTVAVASHSGNPKHVQFTEDGKEREPGTTIKVLDAAGKPIKGLPGNGGYFEVTLPKALLEDNPKSLELGWIDFFRG